MRQRLEFLVAGDEIGLRIDFDDDAVMACDRQGDESFGRDPAGFLRRFRQALLAQPIDRRFDVAVGFGERRLAIHHAGAGLLAKILHHCGRDVRHRAYSFVQC